MKRLILLLLISVSLVGCKNLKKHQIEEIMLKSVTPYEELYELNMDKPYLLDENTLVFQAKQGYYLMNQQGYNYWYYGIYNQLFQEIIFNNTDQIWGNDKIFIDKARMKGKNIARKFISPLSGEALVIGTVRIIEGHNAYVNIYLNDELTRSFHITPSKYGEYIEHDIVINAGDEVIFVVDGVVEFNPVISFQGELNNLHYQSKNDTGLAYVGDVHPFYEGGKMSLYYLSTNGYFTADMVQSDDMILFHDTLTQASNTNPPASEGFATRVVKDGDLLYSFYGAWTSFKGTVSQDGLKWSNAVTLDEKFNMQYYVPIDNRYVAMRDPYAFFDEDINRWRIISLNYTNFDQSNSKNNRTELALYTSLDNSLRVWDKKALSIKTFNAKGEEPEVPQFMKIGNRWYLFAAVSGRSRHHVGPLSYWIGDPEKAIEEVNWNEKEEHLLHGDNLCASQIVKVKDRLYLYGWIIQEPYSSQWGGTINLPFEVYQKQGGTLGVRLDTYAFSLLNKGLVRKQELDKYSEGNDERLVINIGTKLPNSIITTNIENLDDAIFGLEINNDNTVLEIRYNTKQKELAVGRKGGINLTSITIKEELKTILLEVVIEDNIMYVILNNTYLLPVRLDTKLNSYDVNLYSTGRNVWFNDTNIYRLACKENLHK